jgi:AraC-like DNA-binding protein
MNFKLNFFALFPFLTLLQSAVFITLLLIRGKREERKADYWLAAVLFLLGMSGVPYMLGWLGINVLWEDYPFLPWDCWDYAIMPCCYMFLKSVLNENWRFERRDFWYFLLFVVFIIYHTAVGGQGKEFGAWWWKSIDEKYYIFHIFNVADLLLQVYLFWKMLQLYQSYRAWALTYYSDNEQISFKWFRNFLIIYIINFVLKIAMSLLILAIGYNYEAMWWGYLATTCLTYYLSIFGYAQRVRSIRFDKEENTETPSSQKREEQQQILKEIDIDVWKTKILNTFERDKPFLNPELKLSDLASALSTNINILSAVINTAFAKNFNDFVNDYRIEEFKNQIQLADNQHLTMLAVAFDCGFNSKTTFNRAFKKTTGKSPKEWLVSDLVV